MVWGSAEATREVEVWRAGLSVSDRARVGFHVARLEAEEVLLGEPHAKQLAGKLRELRFALSVGDYRLTYFIARRRRIILLTVFRKTRGRDRREVQRAQRAMRTWLLEDAGG